MQRKQQKDRGTKMPPRRRPSNYQRIYGEQVKDLRRQLAVLDTMNKLEIIRRNNLIENILQISTLEELRELIKILRLRPTNE